MFLRRSRRIHQHSSENVRPGFFACVGTWRKSYTTSARRGESTCASKERTALETTRPSMFRSPVVIERGTASPLKSDPMNRMNTRYQNGIWLGMRNNIAECFIGNAEGVFRAREIRRPEPQDRWDTEHQQRDWSTAENDRWKVDSGRTRSSR